MARQRLTIAGEFGVALYALARALLSEPDVARILEDLRERFGWRARGSRR